MNNYHKACLLLSSSLTFWQIGFAADSGPKSLDKAIGASDYFKVNCSSNGNGDTNHLSFSITDSSIESDNSDIPPQVVNARVVKDGLERAYLTASSKLSDEESALSYGNGKYTIYIDTAGTNTILKTPQAYTLDYQCRNSEGIATKSSGFKVGQVKTIKNGKSTRINIQCASNKKILPSETTSLYLKLINLSEIPRAEWINNLPVLNAQVTKADVVSSNTSAVAGESSPTVNVVGGNGDYLIAVNSTATSDSDFNAKEYSFSYSCRNSADLETNTGSLSILQDQ